MKNIKFDDLEVGKKYWVVNGEWEFIVKTIRKDLALIYMPHCPGNKHATLDKDKFDETGAYHVIPFQEEPPLVFQDTLYNADPGCAHDIVPNGYSGVVCTKCSGWFCY